MTKDARNLVILGVASSLIACATTGVSLAIYHNSGDIYLDRSRPGYLPDKEEIEQTEGLEEEYDYDEKAVVTKEVLDKYLQELEEEIQAVEAYKEPFGEGALSDERLGI